LPREKNCLAPCTSTNYFKVTADTADDHLFRFNFAQGGRALVPDYNYNWPYDFFSLVELAKIDVKIGLGDDAFPVWPSRQSHDDIIGEGGFQTLMAEQLASQLAPDPAYDEPGAVEAAVDAATRLISDNPVADTVRTAAIPPGLGVGVGAEDSQVGAGVGSGPEGESVGGEFTSGEEGL